MEVLMALGLAVSSSQAQESRTSEIEKQQAEKSRELKKYEPRLAERIIENLHHWFLDQPSGFYPSFEIRFTLEK